MEKKRVFCPKELLEGVTSSNLARLDDWTSGISTDTRTLQRGEIFVAIKGENFDGHNFVRAALSQGAAVCIVDESTKKTFEDLDQQLIFVADTSEAYGSIARNWRKNLCSRVIAITGSVGKTTTKNLVAATLSKSSRVSATKSNLNNHIGVPKTLLASRETDDFLILEMGMRAKGEISYLSNLAEPDIVLITNIAPAHQEFFSSIEDIAKAKCEIFDGLRAGGIAVLNQDDDFFSMMLERAGAKSSIITYGAKGGSDVALVSAKPMHMGCEMEISSRGEIFSLRLPIYSKSLIAGTLASAAVLLATQGDIQDLKALENLDVQNISGRGQILEVRVRGGQAFVVDESYNSSPLALKSALANLEAFSSCVVAPKRIIFVMGEMLELGSQGLGLHLEILDYLQGVDIVHCVGGPIMEEIWLRLPTKKRGGYSVGVDECLTNVMSDFRAGDIVLVKGSRSIGLDKIVESAKSLF